MDIATDDDVHQLIQMQNAVRRDAHKTKAFVRFRKVQQTTTDKEHYIAWHRPDHRVLKIVAPFFARRFKSMNWTILTPEESVSWDQNELTYGQGVPASAAPKDDALEELWKTYYASTFNPARIKVSMMKSEMPVRHWQTLPEAELIADLLHQAPSRVETMLKTTEGFKDTATRFLPETPTLDQLPDALRHCMACELHSHATQTVPGTGPQNAKLMLVGEQPGDQEDRQGKPFVGPAGQLLDTALNQAGLQRDQIYVTNVVKHFSFVHRGTKRLHKKPSSREIYACRPWLETEIKLVQTPRSTVFGCHGSPSDLGTGFSHHAVAWNPFVVRLVLTNNRHLAPLRDSARG